MVDLDEIIEWECRANKLYDSLDFCEDPSEKIQYKNNTDKYWNLRIEQNKKRIIKLDKWQEEFHWLACKFINYYSLKVPGYENHRLTFNRVREKLDELYLTLRIIPTFD